MKNIWLFGATKFQGNPKFLYLFLNHEYSDIETYWVADTQDQVKYISDLGFKAVLMGSSAADELFALASVYVVENYRESLPNTINPRIVIANLWHGVGLKHVEFGLDHTSPLMDSIVRKNIRNYSFYKNNLLFLMPSKFMEVHFTDEMRLNQNQIIRGSYPRNIIASISKYATYNHNVINGKVLQDFDEVVLYAPTYRDSSEKISLFTLFSDIDSLKNYLVKKNALFIFKMHHFEEKSEDFIEFKKNNDSFRNFLFWDDSKDIYEIFNQITIGIIDYSSIYYDLLQAGVPRFIRYVPDFNLYSETRGLKFDYLTNTSGALAFSFEELLEALSSDLCEMNNKDVLLERFFGYSDQTKTAELQMDSIITQIQDFKVSVEPLKKLYSFDIFDTLIQRKTVEPQSIFYATQEAIRCNDLGFSIYFIENYPQIRKDIEADLRDVYRKTQFERQCEHIEITFDALFSRLADTNNLTDIQINFLKQNELEQELASVEAIPERIEFLLNLQRQGNDIILISDMYLPESVVRALLNKADPRLSTLKIYLSSVVGDQKSTGKLYKHIFFDLDYRYAKWVHVGDNHKADGVVPKRYGIKTLTHQMNRFIPFEKGIVDKFNDFDGYRIAALINKKRWNILDAQLMKFSELEYYTYSSIGSYFVPYVLWALKDAIKRGYQTLYFISRDGFYLKYIADIIIANRGYNIQTKYIYGSRKAWRLAAQIDKIDDEFFLPFGLFSSMNSYDELIAASQLSEEELICLVPQIKNFKNLSSFRGAIAEEIRQLFKNSESYKQRLLELGKAQRELVIEYLRQEIDFNESFAFVEYWGRGYTQDLLSRLLEVSAGKKINNPFYYVRNYTNNIGSSIRHRFTQAPLNFMFIEPIFATTPYKSVTGYERKEGIVNAISEPQKNKYSDEILAGLSEFTQDYLHLELSDEDRAGRLLTDYAYKYHLAHPSDQYIASVYSKFEDNVNSYGKPREVAPAFTPDLIGKISLSKLAQMTISIPMSLARSSDAARKAYLKKCIDEKVTPKNIEPMSKKFPFNDLLCYLPLGELPAKILILKDQVIYSSIEFIEQTKEQIRYPKGAIVEVISVVWNHAGIPRFLTHDGYISAHKDLSKVCQSNDVADRVLQHPIRDIRINNGYIHDIKSVDRLIALTDINVYNNPLFSRYTLSDKVISKGQGVVPQEIIWGNQDIPCIRIHQGYITASKECLTNGFVKDFFVQKYVNENFVLLKKLPIFINADCLEQQKTGFYAEYGTVFNKGSLSLYKDKAIVKVSQGYLHLTEPDILRVRSNIEDYVKNLGSDEQVITLGHLKIYDDINFERPNRLGLKLKKGTKFEPLAIEWTEGGTPRFKIGEGYVTTNLKFVVVVKKTKIWKSFYQWFK